ncbi:MFS transporter [Cupriavidus sp. AU9028]|uniref:MFS transporter n=1 Tax=Cupriavidus sp. AU9028 TaxID=2871157 RepID=UPI001C94A360|nr:MFS transporter [Cupriavidus sp. AU9028]MBY4897077.1 MFS transporter [Cupriavidus sp. AU9028]
MNNIVPVRPDDGLTQPLPQSAEYDPGPDWRWRFWSVFSGQALSLIGSALTQFVLLWWITDTTGSLSALATAGMAALLPQALLAPLGGTLADRYSRRIIMIVADVISALCMAVLIALFLTGDVDLTHVYVMMAIRSAMQAFQSPAAAASVAMLVPRPFLTRAAGLNQAVQSMTVVAAAPLGAFALGVMPIGWALAIDVATAIAGIVPLLFVAIPQPSVRTVPRGALAVSLWAEFREGVALVWSSPGLRPLYAVLAGVVLVIMPAFTLVPLLVKDHFGGGAAEVALMEGLSGVGMLLGGLLVAAMAPRRHIVWILFGFAASCLSLALTALVPRDMFGAAITWWFLCGVTFVFGNAPLMALLQAVVPHHLQGRALSLLNAIMGLAAPVSLAVVSPLGEIIDVSTLFVVIGVSGAAVSLSGLLSRPLLALRAEQT